MPASYRNTQASSIWVHAVSVGEIVSAAALIRSLREQRPDVPIFVSTTTVAGHRAAKQHLATVAAAVFYAPIDYASIVRKVLRSVRPGLLVVLETEIWPNLYLEAKRAGAAVVVVNGRISNRTWPRYRRFGWFFRPVLQVADRIFAQSDADANRYAELGVPAGSLSVAGNLKYDAAVKPARAVDLPTFDAEPVWIAASTVGPNERGSSEKHDIDEDDLVIASFSEMQRFYPSLLLVLAPRQPARFEIVARKLRAAKVNYVQRSSGERLSQLPGVLLLDTIGELASWYTVAHVAFVGGSLAPRGGHNVLEAAAGGVPVITGPHMQNFQAIASDLVDAGALVQIQQGSELTGAVRSLLDNKTRARSMGDAGARTVRQKAGVVKRITPMLWDLYERSFPRAPLSISRSVLYGFVAERWRIAAEARRQRGLAQAAARPRVGVPVISVGGISVGGAGKTPLVAELAKHYFRAGLRPGILTRGYRRRSIADAILLSPGSAMPAPYTGDEAQIFLRAGYAAVGIGAERYDVAKLMVKRFRETGLLLLDDGFQHTRMPRAVDIVVIDGMDPWGGGAVVPLGRLREPLSVLKQASVFVVTRADDDHRFGVIVQRLRAIAGPETAVFRARTETLGWRDPITRAEVYPDPKRAAAFCGLGNPANFWMTLRSLGVAPAFQWAFPDHHHYRVNEVNSLCRSARAHGASWLLTTEKDCNNLPERTAAAAEGMQIAWLAIRLRIEDEDRFYGEVERRIKLPR